MKHFKHIYLLLLFGLLFTFSGCILGELAMEGGIAGELALEEGAVSLADAEILTAEIESETGTSLIGASEINMELEEIRLVPDEYGGNPKLFIRGRSNPFAEVLENRKQILFFRDGKTISVNENIFSVKGNTVNVRTAPISGQVVAQVYKNDMVTVLEEENGWYKVKISKNGKAIIGYIKDELLTPIIVKTVNHNLVALSDSIRHSRSSGNNSSPVILSPVEQQTRDYYSNNGTNSAGYNARPPYPDNNSNAPVISSPGVVPTAQQSNYYKEVTGTFQGDNYVEGNVKLTGMIQGTLLVRPYSNLTVAENAIIQGTIILSKNSTLTNYGTLQGTLINYGGNYTNHGKGQLSVINHN